jgi:predicted nucleic acid-binding protein
LRAYIDTSFLVSLYSSDANSPAALSGIQGGADVFLISSLGELELHNALELRVFRKEITATQARLSRKNFEDDIQHGLFQLSPIADQVFERARLISLRSTAKLGTRTADILHVAAALELKADSFYSFDRQQRKLAQSFRLKLV